jgi:hypothetical protein
VTRRLGAQRRPVPFAHAALVTLAIAILTWAACARASDAPSVFLFGADLDQARSLAVESAHRQGWMISAIRVDEAVFEQVLEGTTSEDGVLPHKVIRIIARFSPEAEGVRVGLRAQEITEPGGEGEWSTDVTARYRDNLTNALARLLVSWDRATPAIQRHPANLEASGSRDSAGTGEIGTWAYYAEDYARRSGCSLGDRGARLIGSGPEWERHRVDCADGSALDVMCRYGECTGAR